MKKSKPRRIFRRIKIIILTGLLLFVLSSVVSVTAGFIFGVMNRTGFVTEGNRAVIWILDLLFLFMLAGILVVSLISLIVGQKTGKLIEAMKKLTDGEFNVRLLHGKKLTDPNHIAVHTFNNMATRLQSNEELSKDFANNFSHEMKTPLGTINGFAKVLKDSSISEDEKLEYLNIIIDESERLTLLSNNVLMLSRLEKQTEPIKREAYNLTEQIRQTAAITYHKWIEKNLAIIIEGEDITVSANHELMMQVWLNLIDNAIKFSLENEDIHISITKNADRASVSIVNSCDSLTEDESPYLFAKFYQKNNAKKSLGNGMGLTMVKKIAELHGGTVRAELCSESEIKFSVELPISV